MTSLPELLLTLSELKNFALKLTKNREDAEDLMQEVVLIALKNKIELTGTPLRRWIGTIIYNTFVNNWRKKSIRNTYHMFDTSMVYYMLQDNNTPDQSLLIEEIEDAVSKLPTNHRRAISLWMIGFSYKEIAEETNIKLGTVKSRIYLARKQLNLTLSK